jgi:ABC-type transport system involved in multi-copper enzyme maturation permease subunit
MLRVELTAQLLRLRTLVALACLGAVPVVAGVATARHAGHRNGDQSGLFGAGTYSALNHTMASLAFTAPLLLPIVVTLLATAIASADRDWGTLRYLYVAPVSRSRLLAGKLAAAVITTAAAVLSVLVAAMATGLAVFGWHPFRIIDGPTLGTTGAITRVLAASGYTLLCMLSIAAIAFTLGLLLPRGAEALGAAVALVVVASIVNDQSALRTVAVILPVHYWQNWTTLFGPHRTAQLGIGALAQLATIGVMTGVDFLVLARRDPAA